ncbi:hypothetical protein [Paraburkholderia pallida]|uniref:Uncharacterized protein n=1 Tax=Paraburkholderia pallida TaxID=2547399 RepID=A0A4V1B0I9_9BURK|nr:hypothetical protein [Paraburkholderia pallida]QBR02933.1 hypothetical protein E1956_37675 [Paraburkholderia pallida]
MESLDRLDIAHLSFRKIANTAWRGPVAPGSATDLSGVMRRAMDAGHETQISQESGKNQAFVKAACQPGRALLRNPADACFGGGGAVSGCRTTLIDWQSCIVMKNVRLDAARRMLRMLGRRRLLDILASRMQGT